MRFVLPLLGLLALSATSARAQDKPASASMPILSATNTIEACFQEHARAEDRLNECVGRYAEACVRLREQGSTARVTIECYGEEYNAWYARMVSAAEQLSATLSPEARDALNAAQTAWDASHRADCRLARMLMEDDQTAGTGLVYCGIQYVSERAIVLDQWLSVSTQP